MNRIFKATALFILTIAVIGCDKTISGGLTFEEEDIILPKEAGRYEAHYTADATYTISATSGDSWIGNIDTSVDGLISFEYETNNTGETRESIIAVKYDNGTAYLNILQQAESTDSDYAIAVKSVNDYSVTFTISPKTEGIKYFFGVEESGIYSQFSKDQYFIDYEVEQLRKEAEAADKTFEELLETRMSDRSVEYTHGKMTPESSYVIWCCPVDEDLKATSEISFKDFETLAPIQFNTFVEIDGPVVRMTTNPTYDDRGYYFGAFLADECGDTDNVTNVLMTIIQEELEYYCWSLGITVEEYLENILTYGDGDKKMELNVMEEYYGFSVCLDEKAEIASDAEIIEFTTENVKPSDNVITIDITDVTSTGAHYKVTTTNDDTYLFFIDAAENWEDYSDEDLMAFIGGMYPTTTYGRSGNAEGDLSNYSPNTKYMAFAFGCEAGIPTTGLTKVYFTTEELEMSDNKITIKVSDITENSFHLETETTNDDPYVFFADYADNWKDYSDDELIRYIIENYTLDEYIYQGGTEKDINGVEAGKDFVAFAFGYLSGYPTTDLVKIEFSTQE